MRKLFQVIACFSILLISLNSFARTKKVTLNETQFIAKVKEVKYKGYQFCLVIPNSITHWAPAKDWIDGREVDRGVDRSKFLTKGLFIPAGDDCKKGASISGVVAEYPNYSLFLN